MLVYRVENASGTGFYTKWDDLAGECHCPVQHPSPSTDGIESVSPFHRFGFASLDALKQWFSKEIRLRMAETDMRVSVYKVADHLVVKGYRQLIFDKRSSKVAYSLDPVYFSRIPDHKVSPQIKVPMFGKNQEENALYDVVCC